MLFTGRNKIRIFTLFLLVHLGFVTLLSGVLVLGLNNHQHDNNGIAGSCAVCVQIQAAENFLKGLGLGNKITTSALMGIFQAMVVLCLLPRIMISPTLVSLKVRINN